MKAVIIKEKSVRGKGVHNPHKFLGCPSMFLEDAPFTDFTEYDTVIFHYSEEATPDVKAWRQLSRNILTKRPDTNIYNDPTKCDIGDKLGTFKRLSQAGGLQCVTLPLYWPINGFDDIRAVDEFPCVLKPLRGTKRPMQVCLNQAELVRAYRLYDNQPAVVQEFIQTDHDDGWYVCVRFHVVNDQLIDYFARPSPSWNIHTASCWTNPEKYREVNKRFTEWIGDRGERMARDVPRVFGKGWYVLDIVWAHDDLHFVELGYKVYDSHFNTHILKHNLCIGKATEDKQLILFMVKQAMEGNQ